MKETQRIKGYDWKAARAYNEAKKAEQPKPTPRASMNGNA